MWEGFSPLPDRGCKRALVRPSLPQSVVQGLVVHPERFRPFGNRRRATARMRQDAVFALVPSLLNSRCPAAIPRPIPSVVVNSFKACAGRLFSHVGQEDAEIAPSLVNDKSPAAIVAERAMSWIGGARPHTGPRVVGRGSARRRRMAVLRASRRQPLQLEATAGLRAPVAKHYPVDDALDATSASTPPPSAASRGVFGPCEDRPAAYRLPSQVDCSHDINLRHRAPKANGILQVA